MPQKNSNRIAVYPRLGSVHDLWFLRLSGHGIGNSFYTYFHAVVLAAQCDADVIAPPWFSLKIGSFLRRESSNRLYFRIFKPFPGEISRLHKFWTLISRYRRRAEIVIGEKSDPELVPGALNVVSSRKFTFEGLHPFRDLIRERLLGIIRDPLPENHTWGQSGFIAVHVRLGDFAVPADASIVQKGVANVRIPLSWYVDVVRDLRARHPEKPVRVFSDGGDAELRPLLELGATSYRSGSDITDLLAMSSASILVGSNSTYSRWAAFLGDMPSIWLKKQTEEEKPSGRDTPIDYVPLEPAEPSLSRSS
ncbi:alpha-1,2-fucosyltransferase [Methylocella silvestris]|uniref:Glycosyl transferase family 11 n=1 Tax=Methylocella silvestris TaxID=199596 RepID=A0A2J7TF01_METSI|nr:alpha-1,2-fucosyltransferase [Methylocella silvestris]PNG25351.1 hypothetical protein CR492_13535 [Methylocella silvestris]